MKRRAPVVVFLALAALGGCRTCIDAGVPRNYACSGDAGAGVDECPDRYDDKGQVLSAWECNATWGYCFDTSKGEPNPCAEDAQCGGGWRCTPDGRCGDPAQEGDVSTLDVDVPRLLHPLVFTEQPSMFASSAPLRVPGGKVESLLAGRTPGGRVEVLKIQASSDDDGRHFDTAVGTYALAPGPFAVTVAQPAAGSSSDEFLWSFGVNGPLHVRQLMEDGSVVDRMSLPALADASWVAPLLVGGAPSSAWDGYVQVRTAAGLAVVSPYTGVLLDGGTAPGGLEAAVIAGACSDGGSVYAVSRQATVELFRQGPGGREPVGSFAAAAAGDFRLATRGPRTWLSWYSGPRDASGGLLSFTELTGGCEDGWTPGPEVQLQRAVCPPGLSYRSYDLVFADDGAPVLVTECLERDDAGVELNDVVYVGERQTPSAYLPPRIVTRQGDQVFSRFAGGQVTQGPNLLAQDAVSLPQPPEALYPRDGGLFATTERASFVQNAAGFFIDQVPAWAALPARYVESEDWYIARSGVVIDLEDEQAVVLPEFAWDDPSAFVQSEVLGQPDGGGVLIATHDDAFDVAELGDDQPTLATRLKPSPATPILSLALQPARDGGTAEGYLVAGLDLFEVRASTPRRWSASKVTLSGLRPVFVWFDHGRPRALFDDGTVMGLYTRVPLSVTLADEVRAGGQLCGAPFALTASELVRLVPSSSGDGGARYEWEGVDLPGATAETDFSRGRLLTLDDELYVFSNAGEAWKLSPPAGCSP